jgi:CDP-diacylglycerol--glycerol-3-phosphate 3-phosphatidyltransferase
MIKNKESSIQKKLDQLVDRLFLRFIPSYIKPNYVTVLRFALIPAVYLTLTANQLWIALVIFVFAASTDFIDGAMARTRNQVTIIGKVIDPIADKLLILSVLLYIGLGSLIVKVFVIYIFLELIAVISGVLFSFVIGEPIGANVCGKIKMVLQSIGAGLFILGALINNLFLTKISEVILVLALFFAIMAAVEYVIIRMRNR